MAGKSSRNPKEQRRDNAYQILKIIRSNRDDISRKQLTEITGLSFPSVNDILNYLMDFNLVETFEGEGGSRKKVPCYRFSGTGYAVLGLTIVPRKAIGVCCDLNGEILHKFELQFDGAEKTFFRDIVSNFLHITSLPDIQNKKLLSIGVGCPGLVDYKNKKIIYSAQFHELEDSELISDLESAVGLPVFLEHNPNLSAFSENRLGMTKDLSDFIYVILDRGIGGSLFHGGRLFRGDSLFLGEIGHSTIELEGPQCNCGNRGCLEMFVGSEILDENLKNCSTESESMNEIMKAAQKIGMAVSNLICFLGIGNVVFAGSSVRNHRELFYRTREVLLSRTLPVFQPQLDIRKSSLDEISLPQGTALWSGEIALSNLNSLFFGERAPDLPLLLDRVMKESL